MAFLADIIDSFLKRHGFAVSITTKKPKDASPGKHAGKKARVDAFGTQPQVAHKSSVSTELQTAGPFGRRKAKEIYIVEGQESRGQAGQEEISWTDPTSGRVYLIDPRTGNSYLQDSREKCVPAGGSRHPFGRYR